MMIETPLRSVWLVVNAGSGSTDATVLEQLSGQLRDAGVGIAGCTDFPEQPLPGPAELAAADTLLICGGDGTINAAWSAADDWEGRCLVLPGGTMNGLAKALHGDRARDAILSDVLAAIGTPVHPPLACADGHRALVGVILGPAAMWVHAREGVRKGRFIRAFRAARLAWQRSFSRSIRVAGDPGKHRAVIVLPHEDGLEIATVSASGITDAIRLGWVWLLGDWRSADNIGVKVALEVTLHGRRKVRALFDGEPVMLPSPACLRFGRTRLPFIATKEAA